MLLLPSRFRPLLRTAFASCQLLAIVLCLNFATTASAAILVSDDFESEADNDPPADPPWDVLENVSGSGATTRVENGGDPFNVGAANNYLRLRDNSGSAQSTAGISNSLTASNVLGVSFDFFEPSAGAGETFNDELIINILAPNPSNVVSATDRIFRMDFNNGDAAGSTTDYTIDALHHADIILNTSGAAYNYGAGTVADQTADIWIDGVLVVDDFARNGAASNGNLMGSLVFTTLNGGQQNFYIDNLVVTDTPQIAAVPEPASLFVFAFTLLAAGFFARQRKRLSAKCS
jgi:hypothetical protein